MTLTTPKRRRLVRGPVPHLRVLPVGRPVLPDLLTVAEVAERLRSTPQHIYALFGRGLASVKVGRKRLVTVEALQSFIEQNTQQEKHGGA